MLRLFCEGAEDNNIQSRLAVLDIGDPVYDYGFTSGHGVPPERPCAVRDFSGKTQAVSIIHIPKNYRAGAETDWAVIKFNKISTKNLTRYALDPVTDLTTLDQNRYYFAQAFGLSENAQPCKLSILDFSNGHHRASHDCRSIPGQSGSPITRIVDGKHTLVGLHMGNLWMFQSPETGRPDRKGYINLLTPGTVKEIESVIAKNRS